MASKGKGSAEYIIRDNELYLIEDTQTIIGSDKKNAPAMLTDFLPNSPNPSLITWIDIPYGLEILVTVCNDCTNIAMLLSNSSILNDA